MAQTPPIFTATAAWVQDRPFGCPAGTALRDILLTLTGPPRVAACTLSAPVPLDLPGTIPVTAAWPVTQPGVDLCFLIHPAPLPPRVRSRLAQGPALFVHVRTTAEITLTDEAALLPVRARLLRGELRALALRHPEFAGELNGLAALAPAEAPTPEPPTLAVIGPAPERRRELSARLADFRILESGDVDAVVAVAAPEGWAATDAATLIDARNRIGRLVSTAPLPDGVAGPGVAVARRDSEVPDLLEQLLTRPRAGAAPAPEPGNWHRALTHLRRQGLRRLEREVNECTQTSQLAAVAERHGLGELPARGRWQLLTPFLVALVVGIGVGRVSWPLHPGLAVVGAVVLGGLVGLLRWRQAQRHWLREAADVLRRRWMQPDITSVGSMGPVGWLRRELVVEE